MNMGVFKGFQFHICFSFRSLKQSLMIIQSVINICLTKWHLLNNQLVYVFGFRQVLYSEDVFEIFLFICAIWNIFTLSINYGSDSRLFPFIMEK